MSERAVYDTMIFFQWAVLPEGRQHRTVKALYDGSIRLCLSPDTLDEVRAVLNRPELTERFPSLTADRTDAVLREARRHADWFEVVPKRYSLPSHPKDDHLFNLAIHANARYLVTWENRLLNVPQGLTGLARQLRELAPKLQVITPIVLAGLLQTDQPKNG